MYCEVAAIHCNMMGPNSGYLGVASYVWYMNVDIYVYVCPLSADWLPSTYTTAEVIRWVLVI